MSRRRISAKPPDSYESQYLQRFRSCGQQKDIEAVVIATPDIFTLRRCRAPAHRQACLIDEKPAGDSHRARSRVVRARRPQYKRCTQMERNPSGANYRRVVELVKRDDRKDADVHVCVRKEWSAGHIQRSPARAPNIRSDCGWPRPLSTTQPARSPRRGDSTNRPYAMAPWRHDCH